jgi:hypothetical protein
VATARALKRRHDQPKKSKQTRGLTVVTLLFDYIPSNIWLGRGCSVRRRKYVAIASASAIGHDLRFEHVGRRWLSHLRLHGHERHSMGSLSVLGYVYVDVSSGSGQVRCMGCQHPISALNVLIWLFPQNQSNNLRCATPHSHN